jgi:hypothetical protein
LLKHLTGCFLRVSFLRQRKAEREMQEMNSKLSIELTEDQLSLLKTVLEIQSEKLELDIKISQMSGKKPELEHEKHILDRMKNLENYLTDIPF